uniref:Uncharacterized protein LOC104216631 isoform X1 n=1 Tax=Nicotiana sylvestris TaxID=4096 RepID=A0A1U7VSX9_NICSY|nr:PREDICTED: uncharacterized protein LOC104216631 isoform X1 [Nicotiana sylvestris]
MSCSCDVAVEVAMTHLVDPSPWPISGSLGALETTVGGVRKEDSEDDIKRAELAALETKWMCSIRCTLLPCQPRLKRDAFLAVSLGEELRLEWIEQLEGHSSSRAQIGTLCRVVPLETLIAQSWELGYSESRYRRDNKRL